MENQKENPPSQNATARRSRNVWYVGLLSFFGGISQDIFSPILPLYLTSVLGFDKTVVGIAEGVVNASAYLFRIVSGWLSDKFSKQKPIIFLGYFLSMIGRALLVVFSSFGAVVGLRILDGAGKGLKDPPKDVLIAGSSEKNNRGKSFGVARMLDTLGSVAGPMILYVIMLNFTEDTALYHKILIFSAIVLVATLILVFKLRELPKPVIANHSEIITSNRTAHKFPTSFYIFIFIVFIFTLGNSSDAFLVLRAKNLGLALIDIPLVIALFNLVYAGLSVPFGSLSDKIGRMPTLIMGWSAYALAYLGFALANSTWMVWFLYAFYGIYYATSEGVSKALLADIVSKDHRGRAFGIYGMTVGLTALPASFLAGFLWDKFGAPVPFFFGFIISLLAVMMLIFLPKKYKTIDR